MRRPAVARRMPRLKLDAPAMAPMKPSKAVSAQASGRKLLDAAVHQEAEHGGRCQREQTVGPKEPPESPRTAEVHGSPSGEPHSATVRTVK